MRFDSRLLDEIRARITLSDLVGRRVTWDRRKTQPGKGDYWACCPFHQEKSPSFHVDDRRNRYKCFGCGASGDHFRFLTETEGLSFPEAVERLAEQAGVALPAPDPQAARREQRRAGLAEICEMAARFFQAEFAGPRGTGARDYVQRRGFLPATLTEFRFGFAPDTREGLKRHLLSKGVLEPDMVEAGLLIRPEDGRPSYDRFRGRLMIPIQDSRGRVVAFGGRTLSPDGQPKYLNSPETPLFHKGVMLFNAHRAREPAFKSGQAYVVEGYLDAIALAQAGLPNAVATLGTAFTEDQVLRLWKLAPEPIVCFDGDAAGISAAHRAIDRIFPVLKSGYSFQFCFLPDGMDPDDLIRQRGVSGFEQQAAAAQSLFDVVWDREVSVARLDTPERKAALEKRFDDLIETIRDLRVKRRYQLDLKFRLSNLFFEQARQSGRFVKNRPEHGVSFASGKERVSDSDDFGIERQVIGICRRYPHFLDRNFERFSRLPLRNEWHVGTRDLYCRVLDDAVAFPITKLTESNDDPLREILEEEVLENIGLQEQKDAEFATLNHRLKILKSDPPERFVEDVFLHYMDVLELNALKDELELEVADAGESFEEADWERLQALIQDLKRRREECAREEAELAERAKKLKSAAPGAGPGMAAAALPAE
ncbi:MAG: DNA primase [Roseibium sp.]|nr:DNA primase [Roseibium sp.]